MIHPDVLEYNKSLSREDQEIAKILVKEIDAHLPEAENKIWHKHPVWFLDGNPVVGYSRLKESLRLMFWSGADFNEEKLQPGTGKFKDASIRIKNVSEINVKDLRRWLKKAQEIQWDYKNIYKRKGKLIKLTK